MTSRQRVIRALEFDRPDRAPRDLWALPGVSMLRNDELEALLSKYQVDFERPGNVYGASKRERGTPNEVGASVDAWGCEFVVAETGVVGEVKHPPLADWSRWCRSGTAWLDRWWSSPRLTPTVRLRG